MPDADTTWFRFLVAEEAEAVSLDVQNAIEENFLELEKAQQKKKADSEKISNGFPHDVSNVKGIFVLRLRIPCCCYTRPST